MMRAILILNLPSHQATITPKLKIIGECARIDMMKVCNYFNERTKNKTGNTEIGIILYDDKSEFGMCMGDDLKWIKGIYQDYITQDPNFHIRNYYLKLEKERNTGWNSGYLVNKKDLFYPIMDNTEDSFAREYNTKTKEEKIRMIHNLRNSIDK